MNDSVDPGESIYTIVGVRGLLNVSKSSHAALLISILDKGRVGPLKTQNGLLPFGSDEKDQPKLRKRLRFVHDTPAVNVLKDDLVQTLNDRDSRGIEPVYSPSTGVEEKDLANAQKLIKSLDNPSTEDALIPNLDCEGIQNVSDIDDLDLHHPTELFRVPVKTSVLASNALIDLQHNSESFTYLTLLTGTMIWILWPPTAHNLSILRQAYDATAALGTGFDTLNVSLRLENGITCVQQAGEGLRVPPFSIMLAMAQKQTILAKCQIVTSESLVKCLHMIPFCKSFWATEVNPRQQETQFAQGLFSAIVEILDGQFDELNKMSLRYPVDENSHLSALLRAWDEVKQDVLGIMDEDTIETLKQTWLKFVRSATTLRCLVCGGQTRKEESRGIARHFVAKHWVTTKIGKGAYM